MNKLILAVYLFSLIGLVTSWCDCCDQCAAQTNPNTGNNGGNNGGSTTTTLPSGSCPALKVVSGGLSGSGFASRYWDCCKPSCSWTNNAGAGNEARQCSASMDLITDYNAASKCDGGPATTCLSQIPFTLDGCDDMGFAFGAVPGAGPNVCGRCFLLEFTGEGKYETKKNHQSLKNKKLLVMASNIGYDVAGGQFDVMIPGGGVGLFNGCDDIFGSGNMGAQYGGLLSDCENEVGWSLDDNSMYTKRKECLTKKCNSVFTNEQARKGCLFLADYMEAAGNPLHKFKEVECPQFLKDLY